MNKKLPERNIEIDAANLADYRLLQTFAAPTAPDNHAVRHVATIVRRFLLDQTLEKSASPRGIKLAYTAPDTNALRNATLAKKLALFFSAGVQCYGFSIAALVMQSNPYPGYRAAQIDHDPSRTVILKRDSFLNQVVAGFNGSTISRKDIVLYVANKAAGVHFDLDRTSDKFFLVDRIRHSGRISFRDGNPNIEFDLHRLINPDPQFAIVSGAIDFVFLEFLAAIQWILASPTIQGLFEQIASELAPGHTA
ncbi:hypothetical protein [Paraburkholderia sp. J63]|uniref:hypothetical protein n=1 Tax=Paraburkholderia sp. J63 TaxID=2805434 RepID=UPI002ABD559C|nr:hypothetical protein [Paraburkholderia sp. J63]